MGVEIKEVFDDKGMFVRREVSFVCDGPSLTKQSESDACDINKIMQKYERTGVLQHVNQNAGFYADVAHVPDFQAALAVVEQAESMFMSLPGDLRARFENDPQQYLDFVSNPANKEELVKLGLMRHPVAPDGKVDVTKIEANTTPEVK